MAVRITHVRLSGGTQHEHIVHFWWVNPGSGKSGDNTKAVIVDFLEGGGSAHVEDGSGHRAEVRVVVPDQGAKFLRTVADGRWANNLLSLPRR